MATDCQMAMQSGGSEHKNLGAINSFEGKKGGWSTLNEEPNNVINLCFFFSFFCDIHGIHCMESF